MKHGRPAKKYSENIRKFCMALQFTSAAAYRYVRTVFAENLPHPVTITKWYRSVDGSPGITLKSLQVLKQKAESYMQNGKKLLVTLMNDEMSIKKKIEWDQYQGEFRGFVTCKNSENTRSRGNRNVTNNEEATDDGYLDVAKDVLVFLVVGEEFKIPVAYFLLNGLRALERASLTKMVIQNVNETGAQVTSLTADGLVANITTATHLGADFKNNKPFFSSPTNPNDKIYIIMDAPHMLKLARKCFAEHNLYYENNLICWRFVVELHNMQKVRNINLGNKLTQRHIDYYTNPMNVRLASETMSSSVVDCIDQLREDGYEQFQNSSETTKFIKLVNDVFDISNVHENDERKGYKIPICESTSEELFRYFAQAKRYLAALEIDEENPKTKITTRKLALHSRSYTPIFGMLHNLTSFEGLYNDHVLNGSLESINTFQLSQDHLETWFSAVRSGLGSNDNPTANEFKYIYRKLLVCNDIVYSGRRANCISNETGILTVSSASITSQSTEAAKENRSILPIEIELSDLNYDDAINETIEKFDEHLNALIGSQIEQTIITKMKKQNKKSCIECVQAFGQNEKINDEYITRRATKTGTISDQPCKNTVDIIKISNKIIALLPDEEIAMKIVVMTIFNNLDLEQLFSRTRFEEHLNKEGDRRNLSHRENFIYCIVRTYIDMKSKYIGGKISDEARGEYIRHKNKKQVHFAGQ